MWSEPEATITSKSLRKSQELNQWLSWTFVRTLAADSHTSSWRQSLTSRPCRNKHHSPFDNDASTFTSKYSFFIKEHQLWLIYRKLGIKLKRLFQIPPKYNTNRKIRNRLKEAECIFNQLPHCWRNRIKLFQGDLAFFNIRAYQPASWSISGKNISV